MTRTYARMCDIHLIHTHVHALSLLLALFMTRKIPRRKLIACGGLQVPLAVVCLAPFLAAPQIQLGYSVGRHAMSQALALPLVVPKFCTPPSMAISREAFFERWRALDGAPCPIPSCCLSHCSARVARYTVSRSICCSQDAPA